MSLLRFYPVADLNSLHRQMNRLFDELSGLETHSETTWKPAIELKDEGDNLRLRAMIPGFKASDLDITVTHEAVTISAESAKPQEQGYYISEFPYGKFTRTINLPVAIQNDKVIADYQDGILSLTLPKVEAVKNKVVKINGSSVLSMPN